MRSEEAVALGVQQGVAGETADEAGRPRRVLTAGRNRVGLTQRQIAHCREAWRSLCDDRVLLDVSKATETSSKTRFSETKDWVYLGADAYPGEGSDANSRMSVLACLAHELAHAERFRAGYRRPLELPDVLLDEAETSLRASFAAGLRMKPREDLVEDARDRLIHWLSLHSRNG